MSSDTDLQHISARLDGVGRLLRDFSLTVPTYQRPYAWGHEQVDAFWLDLRAAIRSADRSYFLGTVVLAGSKSSRNRSIIDGQQRLATTALLLAAIRDCFIEFGDKDGADVVSNDYLTHRPLKAPTRGPRLKLNTQDAPFFETAILGLGTGTSEPLFTSNTSLLDAHTLLKNKLSVDISPTRRGWRDQLLEWVDFLESGAKVIVVEVLSEEDAFLVFETLNDRGLPLSVADLLKNHIFSLVDGPRPKVERSWLKAISTLDEPDRTQQFFLDFLRHYWSSLHGITRERDLYRSLRRHLRSEKEAIAFSKSIESASKNYLALITGDASLWHSDSIADDLVVSLWRLKLSQNLPMLLAAMDCFTSSELANLIRLTISWGVRGLVVGGIGGGVTEAKYAEVAVDIRKGKVTTSSQVLTLVRPIIPTDEVFAAALATTNVGRQSLVRYLLLAFERYGNKERNPALVPRSDEVDALAFRLPRESLPFISKYFEDADAPWGHRLGSYVLVEKPLARKLGVATSWSEIASILSTSDFSRTRVIADLSGFAPPAVRKIQKELSDIGPRIWPDA